MKANSLMQRRSINLGQLKSTIKQLSILQRDKQPLEKLFFSQHLPKSSNDDKGQQESRILDEKAFEFIPRVICEVALNKKLSEWPEQPLKNFDELFQAHQILGEGAHGVVKRCTHKSSGNVYAVKILKMQDEHFQFLKTNFINIKKLKHDSVISYKALFLNSKLKKCHLVMQYLPYRHLKRPLKEIKEEKFKSVFYRLLDALEFIHKNGICHRDIKPENVLYDCEKQIFKIIDFGISKNMKLRGRYQEMLTKTGTLYYKAPEMFYGGGYTQKVDAWAAGVTLYEMVVGCTPFASEYLAQTIENILHKEPDLQREEFKPFQPVLKDLIARLLKRSPKERLSCEQAKKHLWFNSNLQEIEAFNSANFEKLNMRQSQKQSFLTRKSTLGGPTNEEEEVTKTDKKVMKKYLEIMSKQPSTIEEELSIDFVESEDEEAEGEAVGNTKKISGLAGALCDRQGNPRSLRL